MPSSLEPSRRRGPNPKPERGVPSGFRITERQRFELQMAANFFGTTSLQATIELAVEEMLRNLKAEPGFEAALKAAEAYRQRQLAIPRLRPDP